MPQELEACKSPENPRRPFDIENLIRPDDKGYVAHIKDKSCRWKNEFSGVKTADTHQYFYNGKWFLDLLRLCVILASRTSLYFPHNHSASLSLTTCLFYTSVCKPGISHCCPWISGSLEDLATAKQCINA